MGIGREGRSHGEVGALEGRRGPMLAEGKESCCLLFSHVRSFTTHHRSCKWV